MKTNFRTVYVAEMLTLLTSHNFLGGKKKTRTKQIGGIDTTGKFCFTWKVRLYIIYWKKSRVERNIQLFRRNLFVRCCGSAAVQRVVWIPALITWMSMLHRRRRAEQRAQTPQPRAAAIVSLTATPPLMSAVYLQLAALMVSGVCEIFHSKTSS